MFFSKRIGWLMIQEVKKNISLRPQKTLFKFRIFLKWLNMDGLSMIPELLKILAVTLLMVCLGGVVLIKAENFTLEPIQSSD
jgi:hypothetical protein